MPDLTDVLTENELDAIRTGNLGPRLLVKGLDIVIGEIKHHRATRKRIDAWINTLTTQEGAIDCFAAAAYLDNLIKQDVTGCALGVLEVLVGIEPTADCAPVPQGNSQGSNPNPDGWG